MVINLREIRERWPKYRMAICVCIDGMTPEKFENDFGFVAALLDWCERMRDVGEKMPDIKSSEDAWALSEEFRQLLSELEP